MRNRNLGFSLVAATIVCIVPMLPAGCSSSSSSGTSTDSGFGDSAQPGSDAAKSDAKADAKSDAKTDAKGGKDSAAGPDTSTGNKDTGTPDATKGDGGSDATVACVPAHCAPYTCGATVCLTGCTADTDCATGNYCTTADSLHDGGAAGACVPLEANGQTCGGPDQCTSTFCANATCCNSACAGACQTCATGTCSNVAGGTTTATCLGANACSAAGTCLLAAGQDCTADTQCVSGECESFDGGIGVGPGVCL